LVKKLTVIGIIGNTQGVNKAANPEKKAIIKIDNKPFSGSDVGAVTDLSTVFVSSFTTSVEATTGAVLAESSTKTVLSTSFDWSGMTKVKFFSKLII
jgi:hypothetical protein